MAEHLLHAAQIGAALEQVGREGVAEQVGVDATGLEPCALGDDKSDARERAGSAAAILAGRAVKAP